MRTTDLNAQEYKDAYDLTAACFVTGKPMDPEEVAKREKLKQARKNRKLQQRKKEGHEAEEHKDETKKEQLTGIGSNMIYRTSEDKSRLKIKNLDSKEKAETEQTLTSEENGTNPSYVDDVKAPSREAFDGKLNLRNYFPHNSYYFGNLVPSFSKIKTNFNLFLPFSIARHTNNIMTNLMHQSLVMSQYSNTCAYRHLTGVGSAGSPLSNETGNIYEFWKLYRQLHSGTTPIEE